MATARKIDLTRPLNLIYDIAESIGDLKVNAPARKVLAGVIDDLLKLQTMLEELG